MKKEQTTDKNSWNFHLTRSIADLYDVTLEIHTEFWLSTLQIWFRGYQTPEGYKATIWGKKVDLHIAIAPLGTPSETLPVIKENTTRSKNAQLPSEQQIYVNELQKKIKSLKKHLPPKVDEVLEQRCLDEMNADRIKTIIRECDTIWGDKGLSVEEKINRLIDAILVMQEQEDTTTPALRSQLAETESSIGNILKAIEQGIFTPSTKQRLDELEARKEEILVNIQTAELQKPKLTREQMTAWFEQFRHGDPANRDFQKRLIDTFVNAVYVFDDKLVLTYNYQHGMQTISLDEIASALSSDLRCGSPP